MAKYTLNSKVNFGKFVGKTVQQCIDNYTKAWSNIINKHIDWYDEEVIEYLQYTYNNYREGLRYAHKK